MTNRSDFENGYVQEVRMGEGVMTHYSEVTFRNTDTGKVLKVSVPLEYGTNDLMAARRYLKTGDPGPFPDLSDAAYLPPLRCNELEEEAARRMQGLNNG